MAQQGFTFNAYDSFIKAAEMNLIPCKLAEEIAPSTGERDILVHDYEASDDLVVSESILQIITIYRLYLQYFRKSL